MFSKNGCLINQMAHDRSGFKQVSYWWAALSGVITLVFAAACSSNSLVSSSPNPTATITPDMHIAETMTPTFISAESNTPIPANSITTITPTLQSRVSITIDTDLTSVVLRSCPSTQCSVVGEITAGQPALAVGMLSDGSWIMVAIPNSPDDTAWVYGKLIHFVGELPPVVQTIPSTSATPLLPAIALQACQHSDPIKLLLGYLPEHPTQLIEGGYVQSGDFIFEIWLGCDALFGPQAEYSNHYSNVPGLGIHLALFYLGTSAQGEILETWGITNAGKLTFREDEGSSTSGTISSAKMTHLTGLQIPSELLTDSSRQQNLPLEFIYLARNPQKEWSGASISFTLTQKQDGYYPTNIAINQLPTQILSEWIPNLDKSK